LSLAVTGNVSRAALVARTIEVSIGDFMRETLAEIDML
jgi:hypothetical protein